MKKYKQLYAGIVTCLAMILISSNTIAQKRQIPAFEKVINQAIQKAYPASVRMWGFDVQQNQRTSAQFSGVVVSADGYILTAAHTIVSGKNYKVFFPDGKECIALALGRIDNPSTPGMPDVGMMKITDKGIWPFAEMGYSGSLLQDEPCISISYPESLNQTLPTLRLGQVAEVKNKYGFIRSTCKMEPGDSGGPLFDYHGRVIGLHSAIDVAEDQNFEIPVDLYRKYWTALQHEVTYTAFPEKEDSVGKDSLAALIQKENRQQHFHPDFKKLSSKTASACILLETNLMGKNQQLQGTLINVKDSKGNKRQLLVTKYTLLGVSVRLQRYPDVPVIVLAKDKAQDLAVLELKQKIKGGIFLDDISLDTLAIAMGKLTYSLKPNAEILPAVLSTSMFGVPKESSRAFLGAMVMFNTQPALFSLIKPDSPADRAGLKVGDELISINGEIISKADQFAPAMLKLWPDDEITLNWKNNSGTFSKTFPLAGLAVSGFNHPAEKFEGGKSIRRDGFSRIFAHDGAVKANECGSPVFDYQENFLGINIARFSRTSTLCLPADAILKLVRAACN